MSLQRNLLAGLANQVYVTLIGIVLVPLYLRYMGAEAYGLVGFFAMLQGWFSLLDAGLTPTLSREAARHRGGASDDVQYRHLVRVLEVVFLAVASVSGLAISAGAYWIATEWLKSSVLPLSQIVSAIQLMGPIFALRWMCGLYRGALSGAEQLVWLSGFNSAVATLRFAGVLPLLLIFKPTVTLFFAYQLLVAAFETLVLVARAYRQLPRVSAAIPWRIHLAPLRPVLKFSLSIALASSAWILITQTDKLVLSRVLPLAEYGHFTLAALVAGAVSLLSGPIGVAVMPRLARLEAERAGEEAERIYRETTQLVAVVVGAVSVTLAFQAEPLLWAWTGDATATRAGASILVVYALGNGVAALVAFPYYLQFAKGDMRLHLLGNIGFVLVFVPVVIVASVRWGGLGAAWAWLGTNLLTLVVWVPIVHGRFVRGLNRLWFLQDWLPIVTASLVTGWLVSALWPAAESRLVALWGSLTVGLACLAAAALASTMARQRAAAWWRERGSAGP